MTHTLTSIVVQIAAGIVGSNAASLTNLDTLKSTVLGAFAGGVGGYLLEAIPPAVTGGGDPVIDASAANEWVVRLVVALIVGGVLNVIVGFVKSEIAKSRSK